MYRYTKKINLPESRDKRAVNEIFVAAFVSEYTKEKN